MTEMIADAAQPLSRLSTLPSSYLSEPRNKNVIKLHEENIKYELMQCNVRKVRQTTIKETLNCLNVSLAKRRKVTVPHEKNTYQIID